MGPLLFGQVSRKFQVCHIIMEFSDILAEEISSLVLKFVRSHHVCLANLVKHLKILIQNLKLMQI
jgi:hypothetical protein